MAASGQVITPVSGGDGDRAVLDEILDTQISPELVPGDANNNNDAPAQGSEDVVGPYELQDFHLYQVLRYGYAPTKVAFLAWTAWHDRARGAWPDGRNLVAGARFELTTFRL